jgi:hypothetical protein
MLGLWSEWGIRGFLALHENLAAIRVSPYALLRVVARFALVIFSP